MKLLICITLILSVNALDTTEDRSRLEHLEEKMAGVESSMVYVQLSIREMMSVLKLETSGRMMIPEYNTEKTYRKQMGQNQEDLSIVTGEPYDNLKMNALEARVRSLEIQINSNLRDVSIVHVEPSDILKMNDTELEQRVQVLEFQVGNIQEDVLEIETDVNSIEGEIVLIEAEQVIQDQKILDLEDEVEILETDINDLRVSDLEINLSLNELQQNGTELDSRLDELESLDLGTELSNLDSRLDKLELSGTVAFHAELTEYVSIPENTPVVFDSVNLNLGSGYDTTTGEFTVPPEGAGLYYFYFHFEGYPSEVTDFALRKNTMDMCSAIHDTGTAADYGTVSCGAVVDLIEGDIVDVFNDRSTDDTPATFGSKQTTFSGFRIAPQ